MKYKHVIICILTIGAVLESRAQDRNSNDLFREFRQSGINALSEGDFVTAKTNLEAALEIKPDDPDCLHALRLSENVLLKEEKEPTVFTAKLRGSTYIGATLDIYKWGDKQLDDFFGRTYGASFGWNLNLSEKWDMQFLYSGMRDSAESVDFVGHVGSIGLNYLIPTEGSVTPFIGGSTGISYSETKSTSFRRSTSDALLGAQVGAEWEIHKNAAIDFSAFYSYVWMDESSDNDQYGVSATVCVKVLDPIFAVIGASYDLESYVTDINMGFIWQY